MGSSVHQMGYQEGMGGMSWGATLLTELDTLSHALNEVRGRALGRPPREARQVGADAVVGVHTRIGEGDFGTGPIAPRTGRRRNCVRRGDGVHQGDDPHHARPAQSGRATAGALERRVALVLTEPRWLTSPSSCRGASSPAGSSQRSAVFFVSYAFNSMLQGACSQAARSRTTS
jgi:hypothetical protein